VKTYWGSGVTAPRILDSDTRWSEWSDSRPGRFTPGIRAPGTYWIRGWVGPQSRPGRGGEEKNVRSLLLSGIEPRSSSP